LPRIEVAPLEPLPLRPEPLPGRRVRDHAVAAIWSVAAAIVLIAWFALARGAGWW
jgi:hypothetical protein